MTGSLLAILAAFQPGSDEERRDVERIRQLVRDGADPWTRSSLLHATGSAVIVHPVSQRVLLRWHQRQQAWLQVGGHADPGETDPYTIALREAQEETGLHDLRPWPDPERHPVIQVAIVPVPASKKEPVHQHADFRYVLATHRPDDATPESTTAEVRWLDLEEALKTVAEDNLRVCLLRVAQMFQSKTDRS
jgi:8-oxo-dGTP pyrophosphatase MutT (NUDIX family)